MEILTLNIHRIVILTATEFTKDTKKDYNTLRTFLERKII